MSSVGGNVTVVVPLVDGVRGGVLPGPVPGLDGGRPGRAARVSFRVKRMLSSIGSPELVTTTDSEGANDEAEVPPSPASPASPSLKAAL